MVQDVLSQNIDVLVFSPSQPAASTNVLLKAKAKGVPVILVDTGMPAAFKDYATFIGTDNISAGKIGGKALAAQLKKGDKVILLDGAPGNPSMTDRIKGAEEVLKAAGMVTRITRRASASSSLSSPPATPRASSGPWTAWIGPWAPRKSRSPSSAASRIPATTTAASPTPCRSTRPRATRPSTS